MPFLSEAELLWSPVVANSSMNCSRQASGVNSYARELRVDPARFLADVAGRNGTAAWLDLCCGEGRALLQTAADVHAQGQQHRFRLLGVDLLDAFRPLPPELRCIRFEAASVVAWQAPQPFDLITCSHGLHYLGDKLRVLEQVAGWLSPQGLFVAHLDLANIHLEAPDSPARLRQLLRRAGFAYNARTRLLHRVGPAPVQFGLRYLGADDAAGPNYSGQPAVTSHYALA